MKDKVLNKLMRNYENASYELIKFRDAKYPVGTKVRCTLTGMGGTIEAGSFYPNQVRINGYHSSFTTLVKEEI